MSNCNFSRVSEIPHVLTFISRAYYEMNEKSIWSQKHLGLGKQGVQWDKSIMETSKESTEGNTSQYDGSKSQYEELDVVCGETLFKEICEQAAQRYTLIPIDSLLNNRPFTHDWLTFGLSKIRCINCNLTAVMVPYYHIQRENKF